MASSGYGATDTRTGMADRLFEQSVAWAAGVEESANQSPTVDAGGPYAVAEGANVTLVAVGNDPDGDNLSYAWDLDGDGQYDDATGATVVYTGIDGPATLLVSVRVDDGNGAVATDTASITVSNVAPSIDSLTIPSPAESAVGSFVAATSDPAGNNDTLTYLWNFGDGATATTATAAHAYADEGTYSGRFTVSDEDGGSNFENFTVVVSDVAPTLTTLFGGTNLNEGTTSTYRSTIGKANFDVVNWTFIWADGTPNETGQLGTGVTSMEISRPHTFLDNGQFVVTFRAVDDEGNQVQRTRTVNVANVAPTIDTLTIVPDTGPEGSQFGFTGAASDPGADTLTYQWDFGDGGSASGATANHTYAGDGEYTVTLTVTDDDEGSDQQTATVVVTNAAPTIDELEGTLSGLEGGTFSYTASASDPGGDGLTYAWDFGDGTNATGPNVSHVFADNGNFIVGLTVSDDAGATDTGELAVTVTNVAPTATAALPEGGQEGTQLAFASTVSDPGADTFEFAWDFGDGNTSTQQNPNHTYADDGVYFVSLTVTDDDGGEDEVTGQVTVTNVDPQILSLDGDFSGGEGEEFAYLASASDPGADTLTFTWNFGDGTDPQSDVALTAVTHTYADNGTYTLTLTVTDEDGGSAELERTVNVGGQAPTITSLTGDLEGPEGSALSFTASASDPGGDTLTYFWDFGDGNTDQGIDLADVEHVYADNGNYTVALVVTDADGEASANLTVQVRNVSPTFSEVSVPESGAEGQNLSFTASATDPAGDNDPLIFTWNFGDGTDPVTGATANHTFAQDGVFTVTVTVSDDDDGAASVQNSVLVTNVAPTISAFDAPDTLNEASEGTFSATANDPGADTLTYTWTFGDNSDPVTGASVRHTYADNGQFAVVLTVSDDDTATVRTHSVMVQNVAPVIQTLTGDTQGGENETFSYTAAATDVAGPADPLTYIWNFGDGSPIVQGVDLSELDHVYRDAGQYTLALTVNDGDNGQTNRSLIVTVSNLPPAIDALSGDTEGDEGQTLRYTATASDPGGDVLTYTWNFGDGSDPISGVGLDTVDHTYRDDGQFTLTLSVSDGDDTARDTLDITINNVAPTIGNVTIPEGIVEGIGATLSAAATDPAGARDPLTYTWDFGDDTTAVGANVQHTYADNGTYTVSLTVTDGDGGQDQQEQTVVVANARPNILSFGGPDTVTEGSPAAFFAAATDVPADTLTYTWDFEGGPEFDGVDRTEATHTYPDDGQFNIVLTVSDEDGGISTRTRTLTVLNANPTIDAFNGQFNGQEGDTFAFSAAASDPGQDTLTFTWNFGDSNELTSGVDLTGVEHQYNVQGQYTVTLTVTDEDGGSVNTSRTVNVGVAAPTIDTFTAPEGGVEGAELAFTASASDPVDQVLTYTWDFGDGSDPQSGVDLTEVAHTFPDNGSYFVRLTVRDPDDLSATAGGRVEVTNAPPTIETFVLPAFAEASPATATASASDPAGDADPLTFRWDFGDGTPVQTGIDLTSAEHTFAGNGQYTVTLTVTDGDGGSASRSEVVAVGDAPPVITEIRGPASGNEGDTIQYRAIASDPGGDALTFTWRLGANPPVDTADNATFVANFPDDGGVILEVTVTDEEGQTATASVSIEIANLPPTIQSAVGRPDADEGETVTFFALATDPAGVADPLTYTWDFGDGTDPQSAVDLTQIDHAFADDADYTVTVTVDDGDGAQVSQELSIAIANVAPAIVSQPPTVAIVNQEYRYNVVVDEPGDDELTFELTGGPDGMAFDDDQDLVWVLPLDLVDDGPFPVTIRVTDDEGASDEQTFEISTDFIDGDDDGVPDDCERLYGLDPEDPEDAELDNDQDGINNRDECIQGTNPVEFNGPSAPVLLAPENGERVASLTPDLVVENATDPDADTLTYEFELYADSELSELVTSVTNLPQSEPTTLWPLDTALTENSRYYWRARAADPFVSGPWSATGDFLVDEVNEAPSTPTPISPIGSTDTDTPTLLVDASADPEADTITYLFEVWADDAEGELVTEGESAEPNFALQVALTEDTVYFWRAAAADDQGAESPWSDLAPMLVNTSNNLPEAPTIKAPEDGAEVDSAFVNVEWSAALDLDGDALTYEIQVATDEGFAAIVHEESGIPGDGDADLLREVGELAEDVEHFARVRAHDPFGAGAFATVRFLVNAENTKPLPPSLLSPIGGTAVDVGIAPNLSDVELTFSDGIDPDGDPLTYTLTVFDDDALSNVVFSESDITTDGTGTTTVAWTVTGPGTYFWTVEASDPDGLSATAGPEQFSVTVGTDEAPTAPVPLSPINDQTVDPAGFELVVENATDPEGAALTYTFQIYADADLSSPVWQKSDIPGGDDGTTSVSVDDLEAEGLFTLYWVAFANDGRNRGARSETATCTFPAAAVTPNTSDDCACSTPAAPSRVPWGAALIGLGLTVLSLRRR